jgi:hypothetical protein
MSRSERETSDTVQTIRSRRTKTNVHVKETCSTSRRSHKQGDETSKQHSSHLITRRGLVTKIVCTLFFILLIIFFFFFFHFFFFSSSPLASISPFALSEQFLSHSSAASGLLIPRHYGHFGAFLDFKGIREMRYAR